MPILRIQQFTESRSSAVQILPQIQPQVHHLTTFLRSPLWILPNIASQQQNYTAEEIDHFVSNPETLTILRKRNEAVANSIFSMYEMILNRAY